MKTELGSLTQVKHPCKQLFLKCVDGEPIINYSEMFDSRSSLHFLCISISYVAYPKYSHLLCYSDHPITKFIYD